MALVTGSLSATGQSDTANVRGACVVMLSGTWTGTVKLQRRRRNHESTWVDVTNPETDAAFSWTANVCTHFRDDVGGEYRLDFTRSTGTVDYDLESLF